MGDNDLGGPPGRGRSGQHVLMADHRAGRPAGHRTGPGAGRGARGSAGGPADGHRPLSAPLAALLAAGSGALLVAAFPAYGLWWVAPVAVALLAVAVAGQRARRGAWLGALHGAAFFVPLLHWTGIYVGPFPWLLLAAVQSTYLAALGALCAGVWSLPGRLRGAAPLVVAGLWVAQEALRSSWPFGGFPWGRLAFSQGEAPTLRLAALGGAPLVTFAVALAGGLLAAVVLLRRSRGRHTGTLTAGAPRAAVFVAGAAAVVLAGLVVPTARPSGPSVTVAVVQGNVPRLGLDFNAQRRRVLENHVDATLDLATDVREGRRPQPDLVVWPENSSDIDPLLDAEAGSLITAAADAVEAPILVGAVLQGPGDDLTNAGIVWSPSTGPGERYAKRHPVPFAEYVPFRSFARRVTSLVDLVRRDFRPGEEPGVLTVGPARVGDVICFEVAYDGVVRDTVTGGADLLVVQTNNATFGLSSESEEQLAMVRLRAVEHGRSAVMASTTGVSATVDADGRVVDRTGLFTQAVITRELRLGADRTLATRLGALPERVLAVGALLALLVPAVRRRRGTPPAETPVQEEPARTVGTGRRG